MQTLEDQYRDEGTAVDAGPLDLGSAWMRHMRRGEWEQAWRISDQQLAVRARESCVHWPRHLQYVWTGAPLAGRRVLVRCYHGLGDTIQFIRYAPLLKTIASETIVWAQPGLIPLLGSAAGIDRLIPLHDGTPQADYDVDVEIMELPHIFRTNLATVPVHIPYLHAEPMSLPPSIDKRPKVGLVWKAGDWAEQRSIPFALLAPLAALAGVALFILQPGASAAGWNGEFGTFIGEFGLSDYARAIRAMDLLISIDSMPAHLAGAMGVPVWTLLHTDADWRWMDDPGDSPWYPGMRLFRQRRAGDWETVIEDVMSALVAFSSTN
jgi:hypothetical protein